MTNVVQWLPYSDLAPPWDTEISIIEKSLKDATGIHQKLITKYGQNSEAIATRMALAEVSSSNFRMALLWTFKEAFGVTHPLFRNKNAKCLKPLGTFFYHLMLLCKEVHHWGGGSTYRNGSHWWSEVLCELIEVEMGSIISMSDNHVQGKKAASGDNRSVLDSLRYKELPERLSPHLKNLFKGCFQLLSEPRYRSFEGLFWKPFLKSYAELIREPSVNGVVIKSGQVFRRTGKGSSEISAFPDSVADWKKKLIDFENNTL